MRHAASPPFGVFDDEHFTLADARKFADGANRRFVGFRPPLKNVFAVKFGCDFAAQTFDVDERDFWSNRDLDVTAMFELTA